MAKDKDSFIFYRSFWQQLSLMESSMFEHLTKAILLYALDGEEPELNETEYLFWVGFKSALDRDREKWLAVKEKRSKAGQMHRGNQYTRAKQTAEDTTTERPEETTANAENVTAQGDETTARKTKYLRDHIYCVLCNPKDENDKSRIAKFMQLHKLAWLNDFRAWALVFCDWCESSGKLNHKNERDIIDHFSAWFTSGSSKAKESKDKYFKKLNERYPEGKRALLPAQTNQNGLSV